LPYNNYVAYNNYRKFTSYVPLYYNDPSVFPRAIRNFIIWGQEPVSKEITIFLFQTEGIPRGREANEQIKIFQKASQGRVICVSGWGWKNRAHFFLKKQTVIPCKLQLMVMHN